MFKHLFQMLMWKRQMQKQADWFDNNEPAQARFEENEDWLEELEDRLVILEEKIEKLTAAIERTKL